MNVYCFNCFQLLCIDGKGNVSSLVSHHGRISVESTVTSDKRNLLMSSSIFIAILLSRQQ